MGKLRKEETRRDRLFLDFFQTLPLILKLLIAIFGGGTAITIVIVIGSHIQSGGQQGGDQQEGGQSAYTYPTAVQQSWLNDCENSSSSFHTVPVCKCELSYFENHVSGPQFEQDYGDMPPGVVPPELAGAEACLG